MFLVNKDADSLARKRNFFMELNINPAKNADRTGEPMNREILLSAIIAGLPSDTQRTVKSWDVKISQ